MPSNLIKGMLYKFNRKTSLAKKGYNYLIKRRMTMIKHITHVRGIKIIGRNLGLTLLTVVAAAVVLAGELPKHNYRPKNGYVPDEKTAIKIAVAVWTPIYGEKQIESEKPYHAVLTNNVWVVEGFLPEGSFGGTAIAEISRDDGHILRVSHGQ